MDRQKRIEKLKTELATLEGKDGQLLPPAKTPEEKLREVLAQVLNAPEPSVKQEARKQENEKQRVCPVCYRRQPVTSGGACIVCGEFPAIWLPSDEPEPENPAEYARYSERQMFTTMANTYTLEQLQTASRSGWANTGERHHFLKRAIALRAAAEEKNRPPEPEPEREPEKQPEPVRIDFEAAARYYQLQLKKLEAESAQFTSQIR